MVTLTAMHWVYLLFILIIIFFMIIRKDTTLPCIIGIFVIGYLAKFSITGAVISVFNGLGYAIKELTGTILIISIIIAMSKVLQRTGINQVMMAPFVKFIKTPTLAYWIVGIIMMVVSWFFWPSPGVALIGAILLPAAVEAGLPILAVAMSMNLFGHGVALSGDYIIQGAPKLTADGAGIPVESVVSASIPLVIIMGVVTTIIAFIIIKRDMKKGILKVDKTIILKKEDKDEIPLRLRKILATMVYVCFILDVVLMVTMDLKGGDATGLIGGTAVFILAVISMITYKKDGFEKITSYFIKGLQFGFKIFGPVIPIAAFFYLGDMGINEIIGKVLPASSKGLVNDLGFVLANTVPLNSVVGAITITIVGAITGLDGSGFSGISLVGSVAHMFSMANGGAGIATLTAMGQISAIWVGGGTLVPWSLIAVAGICNVDAFELARRNILPVTIGLLITTIVAALII